MRVFRYAADPVCLLSWLCYALNRWVVAPASGSPFLQGTFNDLLLIPAALPPVLWLQRRLGWRNHDGVPTAGEIAGHWLGWSLVCEVLGPLLFPWAAADWRDVVAYGIGALAAGLWWHRPAPRREADFDAIAPHYGWLEVVLAGRKLDAVRRAFPGHWPERGHVLLVGEGPGRFLVTLRKSRPHLRVTCVDASAEMLQAATRRLARAGLTSEGVEFLHASLPSWRPPEREYDLVVTNFFLDCFPCDQLEAVIDGLARAVRPGGCWVVADFQVPATGGLRRFRAKMILWLMYGFFRIATRLPAACPHPPGPLLDRRGFTRVERREFDAGLLYAEVWKAPNGG